MIVDSFSLLYITFCFLLGGLSKGLVGMGLQTICVGLLVALFDIRFAIALLLVPALVTNVWQIRGMSYNRLGRRLLPLLLPACLGIWFGAYALVLVDSRYLSILLALLLLAYTAVNLSGFSIRIPPKTETPLAIVMGGMNGLFTGMTGSFLFPSLVFLQGIGLTRDQFIQAMGLFFVTTTVTLGLALNKHELLSSDTALLSAAACLPAIIGMRIGEKLRGTLNDKTFRLLFFLAVAGVAFVILLRSVWAL